MKKHIKTMTFLLILSLFFSPLGLIQAEEDVELTGQYIQEEQGEAYQSAVITNEAIEIFWHIDGSEFLYWSGTFESPAGNKDSYSWTSQNDTEKTSVAIFASSNPTKEFTIENGVLCYAVTVEGKTLDLALTKEEGVFLDEVGYSVETLGRRYKIYYGYVLKNAFSDRSVFSPEIEIVVKDAEDNIIWKESKMLSKIRAEDTLIGGDRLVVDSEPEVVQIELKPIMESRIFMGKEVGSQAFEVKNLNEINEGSKKSITGEIYNISDQDYSLVNVNILFRLDGEIVGGDWTLVSGVLADSSVEFESFGIGPDNYDNFEVVAYPN